MTSPRGSTRFVTILVASFAFLACSAPPTGGLPAPAEAPAVGNVTQQAEWNALVEAAKKEGKLTVRAGSVQEFRANLPRIFNERFGIELEYISSSPAEFGAQVDRERAAGLYNLDIVL